MRKPAVLVLLWIGTLVMAWLLGRTGQVKQKPVPHRSAADGEETLRYRVDETRTVVSAPKKKNKRATSRRSFTRAPPPTFENVKTLWAALDRIMAWVDKRLREGPKGHKHIVRTAAAMDWDEIEVIDVGLGDLDRLGFEAVRFAVPREQLIVDFFETMYRTAANEPEWFREREEWVFEIFTDDFAELLPIVVDDERLARFRSYAERILEVPPARMNPVLRGAREEFEENLRKWQRTLNDMEILMGIRSTELSDVERLRLIRQVSNDQLDGVDVVGLVTNRLRAGDMGHLEVLRKVALTPADLALLDEAFLLGLYKTDGNVVREYMRCTGRESWAGMREFLDKGFRRGRNYALAMANALADVEVRAPKSYVAALLRDHKFPRELRIKLRIKFLIEE